MANDRDVEEKKGASAPRKAVLIVRRAPYGSVFAAEALRAGIAFSGMGVETSLILVEDGVFCLLEGQKPEMLGMTGLGEGFKNAREFGLRIFACGDSLEKRGMGKPPEEVLPLGESELRKRVREADSILCF